MHCYICNKVTAILVNACTPLICCRHLTVTTATVSANCKALFGNTSCNPSFFHLSCHCTGTLNGIIDTVSAKHDVNALLSLLAPRGSMVVVGLPPDMPTINHFAVVQRNLVYSGSTIGNLGMTQEMLNFCGEKNITAQVEVRALMLVAAGMCAQCCQQKQCFKH
jgi:D-arabinose 1-dehydrogenase-like Zn-dependent alcohol dehydrogenase